MYTQYLCNCNKKVHETLQNDKLVPKAIWKYDEPRIFRTILKRGEKFRGLTPCDFKTSTIKAVWYIGITIEKQINRTEQGIKN